MRPLFFLLVILLTAVAVQGQEPTTYRLRKLTAEEYVAALPTVIEAATYYFDPSNREFDVRPDLYAQIQSEFMLRYGDDAGWQTLLDFYAKLKGSREYWANYSPFADPKQWHLRIFSRWLQENPTDFERTPQLTFSAYSVEATPFDFDSDGTVEYLLYIRYVSDDYEYDGAEEFSHYWLAVPDDSVIGYEIIPLPVYVGSNKYSFYQYEYLGSHFDAYGDFNGDGLPELVFTTSASVPASWYLMHSKVAYLLGWYDGQFKILANFHSQAEHPNRVFGNIDADIEQEWIQTEDLLDNWGCSWQVVTTNDWDGTTYIKQAPVEYWPETFECAMRAAHAAMLHRDYETAVAQYEIALYRFAELENVSEASQHLAAYAHERLVIAYAMFERLDGALGLLASLKTPYFAGDTLAAAMQEVTRSDPSTEALCRAAYEAMDRVTGNSIGRGVLLYRGLPILEYNEDYFYGRSRLSLGPGTAERTACDYPSLLPPTPTWTPPPTQTPMPTLSITVTPSIRYEATLYAAFYDGQFMEAASSATKVLEREGHDVPDVLYMRALANELAGNTDAALADYVTLYEAEWESPWGVLAGIHLEPVQTD